MSLKWLLDEEVRLTLKKLKKIGQGDSLLDANEIANAKAYRIIRHFSEFHDKYHKLAKFFYDSMEKEYSGTHPRTIARLVGTMAEGDEELTKLLRSRGVNPKNPLAKELRFLLGVLAVENGRKS